MNKEKKIISKFETISEEEIPKPKIIKNCIYAFLIGGSICTIGQMVMYILGKFNFSIDEIASITSITMIFIGALLTGVGVYDNVAEFGGAGTVVPITGFANAIVSSAIEFKKEGFVFGVAAKMFTIAGPVLVYGIGTSVIIGVLYNLFF